MEYWIVLDLGQMQTHASRKIWLRLILSRFFALSQNKKLIEHSSFVEVRQEKALRLYQAGPICLGSVLGYRGAQLWESS